MLTLLVVDDVAALVVISLVYRSRIDAPALATIALRARVAVQSACVA